MAKKHGKKKHGMQGTHGGHKDPEANAEHHAMNKKHGTPGGLCPTNEEYGCMGGGGTGMGSGLPGGGGGNGNGDDDGE